jgi:hypothetical protein
MSPTVSPTGATRPRFAKAGAIRVLRPFRVELKAAGCPGRMTQKVAITLTGHKTRLALDRYDIVNEAVLGEAMRKLAAANRKSRRATGWIGLI